MRNASAFARVLVCLGAAASAQLLIAAAPAWVARSDKNARLLIDVQARYSPEEAVARGVQGIDEQVSIPSSDRPARFRADLRKVRQELEARGSAEKDPLVSQDLHILEQAIDKDIRSSEANEKTFLPYWDVGGYIFFGTRSLLDDQVQAARRPAALARLKKYTGLAAGYAPATELAEKLFREKREQNPGLLYPSKAEVEKNLENTETYVTGIGLLLEKYKIAGYQESFSRLKEQLADYDRFVRNEILPKARSDFRLPPDIYAIELDNYGVDYRPDDLKRLAHQSFTEIQKQMAEVARRVAKERGLPSSDYRDVIRALKKEQLTGEEILPHYERRLAEIEQILRANHLISLPDRPAIIRLASAAETAQQPAPHMVPPPLLNNHGERGQFVLPLETKGERGAALKYDDFTFAAASWTLTCLL
jgi:hypothetical protein